MSHVNIDYPFGEQPLHEYLREHARRHPGKAALVWYGREISYAELDRLSDAFAQTLHRIGVGKGDRVVIFMPMVTESFGGWHEVAVTEVERLGAALARQSGQDEDEAVRHLWGKLAILLQRGNAAILGNRVPDFPAPAIDGRH